MVISFYVMLDFIGSQKFGVRSHANILCSLNKDKYRIYLKYSSVTIVSTYDNAKLNQFKSNTRHANS